MIDHNGLIAARRCLLCGALPAPIGLCRDCQQAVSQLALGPHCPRCALPLPADSHECGDCLKRPPPFDAVIAPYCYQFPLDEIIAQCKHRNCRASQNWLARQLATNVSTYYCDKHHPDGVIPMPLHWRRRWQRGFNQTHKLALAAARALECPVEPQHLHRQRAGHSQQGLNRRQRLANLASAFRASRADAVAGRHLALVDDVVTTTATARRAALALKRAGAARVDIWALARTP